MEVVTIALSVVLGVALAASCGLRAFLPLFIVGMAARLGFVDLGDAFAWLSHTPALLALGVAVIVETAGDKIPWLHHLLDALATPVRAVAGALVCAAVMVDLPVWVVAILALIVGGGVAIAVSIAKSGIRKASSIATADASTPAHSLAEDVACLASTVLSMAFTMVAIVVAAIAVFLLVKGWRSFRERREPA